MELKLQATVKIEPQNPRLSRPLEGLTVAVHDAEVVLGVGVALLCERAEFLQSRLIVAPVIGFYAFVEASPRRPDEHDENNDKEQSFYRFHGSVLPTTRVSPTPRCTSMKS